MNYTNWLSYNNKPQKYRANKDKNFYASTRETQLQKSHKHSIVVQFRNGIRLARMLIYLISSHIYTSEGELNSLIIGGGEIEQVFLRT